MCRVSPICISLIKNISVIFNGKDIIELLHNWRYIQCSVSEDFELLSDLRLRTIHTYRI